MTTTQPEHKSAFSLDGDSPEKWRVCMRDSKGRTKCLPWCNSIAAADVRAYGIRYDDPSIKTTLVPCTFLPQFLDVLYAEHNAKRVFTPSAAAAARAADATSAAAAKAADAKSTAAAKAAATNKGATLIESAAVSSSKLARDAASAAAPASVHTSSRDLWDLVVLHGASF